jgi:amino acid adenylation domain-containing protein
VTTPGLRRSGAGTAAALFERCVRRHPNRRAVDDGSAVVDYDELNARANRLGRRLLAAGVGAEDIVALALPRSIDLIVAVLAVLKAGAAYLPLDTSYPRDRLAFMMRDARPVLTITTRSGARLLQDAAGDVAMLELDRPELATVAEPAASDIGDDERAVPADPHHAMYVIYTSGSTGTPKGVVITGAGMPALADTQQRALGVGPGCRVLQWASTSFDAAFWEMSAALFSGATLVLAPGDRSLPDSALHHLLRNGHITHATLPPAVLAALDDDVLIGATIVSTGDSCTDSVARRWARGRRLLNGYGPTETTVGATISGPYRGAGVPIGRPFTDTVVHLLDQALRPVARGEVGEIYVGGPGLARCYLGRPALTAARFVASPFDPGKRLYRTGDLACVAEDGQFVFRGRSDDQVKIRGFRVELGELESVLAQHPLVRQVAVIARDDEHLGRHLVAYVVTDGADSAELCNFLRSRVPDYVIPSAIVEMAALPLMPNGKVDRRALPQPAHPKSVPQQVPSDREQVPSDREQYLCRAISELLGVEQVGPADDFFALGGHSLLAARLIGRVKKDLGLQLAVKTFYESRTIAEIAAGIA